MDGSDAIHLSGVSAQIPFRIVETVGSMPLNVYIQSMD